jgi:hypothetical protein
VVQEFERVYTVTDYYDGPRGGVADFQGTPHVYRSLYLDSETWDPDENRFELTPISQGTLRLALESWAIWERGDLSVRRREIVAIDPTDPNWGAMPEDLARRDELALLLEPLLVIDSANRVLTRGEFRVCETAHELPWGVFRSLEVRWTS